MAIPMIVGAVIAAWGSYQIAKGTYDLAKAARDFKKNGNNAIGVSVELFSELSQ